MKKILASLLLLLVSGSALAGDSAVTDPAVANHTDLSINFLDQIFGNVGNTLHGTTGQMLGHLFYKLNEGIIIIAGIWLAYTVFTIVIRSAQEGSFMGANKNVALAFLKIAFGFSLLIPSPATGYSLLQDVVMKVVVGGVGLADATWRNGLQYVQDGGTLWHRPADSGDGNKIISNSTVKSVLGGTSASGTHTGPGEQIFADEVCMLSSTDNQPQSKTSPPLQYSVITNDSNQTYDFPGIGNNAPLGPGDTKCGSVSWNVRSACSDPTSSKCTYAKYAVGEMITNLLPAAKREYCSQHSSAPSCSGLASGGVKDQNTEVFFGSLVNYVNSILPVVQMNKKNSEKAKDFIKEAEKEGWLSAGRYYWDLSQVQSHYKSVSDVANYAPPTPKMPTLAGAPLKDAKNAVSDSYTYIPGVYKKLNYFRHGQNAGDTGDVGVHIDFPAKYKSNKALSVLYSLLFPLVHNIIHLLMMFKTGAHGLMGYDPILFLHNVGMYCISIAGDIWIGWTIALGVALLISSFCTAFVNFQVAVNGIFDWIKPLLIILAGTLWGTGFLLAFYLPMYPYIIFTFGVIGWFIAVIEAMVAAPLVAFGLTHPEGHDFLGEAKQSLILLLGAFLRPVLMVIGLIGAMILSYVSLRMVIYTFSGFVTDLFYTVAPSSGAASGNILLAAAKLMQHAMWQSGASGNLTGIVVALLLFPLTLVIFTALVYVVTTYCFSLIFVLPDNILKWIGGPQSQSMAAEMAKTVQGAMSSATKGTGKALDGTRKQLGDKLQQKQQQQNSQVERPDSGGSGGGGDGGGSNIAGGGGGGGVAG